MEEPNDATHVEQPRGLPAVMLQQAYRLYVSSVQLRDFDDKDLGEYHRVVNWICRRVAAERRRRLTDARKELAALSQPVTPTSGDPQQLEFDF